jgi:ATP-binding cassette subfamily B protein
VKLVNRTYDVNAGQVLVDGVDVREWKLETLRRGISMIEQDIFLFSRSIAENISFGKPDATQDEIRAAARAAQADEFILEFSDEYQTVIGERGVTLSGGQRQRLALGVIRPTAHPGAGRLDQAIASATEDHQRYHAASTGAPADHHHRLSQIRCDSGP